MPWTKVYGDRSEFDKIASVEKNLRGLTYAEALAEATEGALSSDPDVFVLGVGVDDPGGVFGSSLGLIDKFGPERVMDTALAENGITGIAIGAAIAGMRPLLVHMRVDFLPLSLDQIMNHAAKWHYMFAGRINVPITIRAIIGRGWGSGAQHSQSLQSLFTQIPGLKVVMPATPYDAKGLLLARLYDNNPVIFIEHRWLYGHVGHVPKGDFRIPLGTALTRREGTDVTIVATSLMVFEAIKAAEELAADGIEAEIIDLRTLKPMDTPAILKSVEKTGRLVIADTGGKDGGIGAEISARVAEEGFGSLKAPIARVGLPDVPTPTSHILEEAFYRGRADIVKAVRKIL